MSVWKGLGGRRGALKGRGLVGETCFPPRERAEGDRRSRRRDRDAWPAELVRLDEEVEQPPQLALDLGRAVPVPFRVPRVGVEVEWLAEGDRNRVEVPEPPVLRAVDRTANHGRALLDRDHRRAGLDLTGFPLLTRAFWEHAQGVSPPNDLPHQTDRLTIRFASADGQGSEDPEEGAEERGAHGLLLGDVVHRARDHGADRPRVEPREVVEAEDDRAVTRDALRAVVAQRRERPHERAEERPPDQPRSLRAVHGRGAAARSCTSRSICATTSSTWSSVVSIWTASAAGRMRAASLSSRRRRSVASASAPMSGPSITTSPCSPSSR